MSRANATARRIGQALARLGYMVRVAPGAVAIDDVDGLEVQFVGVERDALGAFGVKHRLTIPEPKLAVLRPLRCRKVLEYVFIIDDTVLENFDKGRALVRMGGPARQSGFWEGVDFRPQRRRSQKACAPAPGAASNGALAGGLRQMGPLQGYAGRSK